MNADKTLVAPTHAALRQLSRVHCDLIDAVAVRQSGHALAAASARALGATLGTEVTLRPRLLEASVESDDLREGCCFAVLSLANCGERAVLEVENAAAAALVERLAGGATRRAIPAPLTAAEAAATAFLVLSTVQAARGVDLVEREWALRFGRIARDRGEVVGILQGRCIAIDFEVALETPVGGGRLLIPATAVARVCAHRRAPAPEPAESIGASRLAARLRAPGAELTADELASLAPGDALLLDSVARTPQGLRGPAWLAFEHFELRGSLEGRALTVAEVRDGFPLEAVMETSPVPPPLPVSVEVELARVRVPLAELGRIRPGAVLPLDVSLSDPVLLRIGDRAIARAELVDIDGELGARILALLS